MLHAVIMAGGSGTRFWPLSRMSRPKHLLSLLSERTLIQETVDRILPAVTVDSTWVITGEDHAQELRDQLPLLPAQRIVAEPCRRDTAACIGLAATLVQKVDPDSVMVVMPADHKISDSEAFRADIQMAVELVEEDPARLITFGINPDRPATGYGYIHRGEPSGRSDNVYDVESFREKPDPDTAQGFLDAGGYYWNSGIFVWKSSAILNELQQYQPEIARALKRIAPDAGTDSQDASIAREYEGIERISIDYAVMERAQQVLVVEASFPWDDVGSWAAIARHRNVDDNAVTKIGNSTAIDTKNCVIVTDETHLVATIGVEDLIIVHTDSATLVAHRSDEEAVKQLVQKLQDESKDRYL